jgi:hypothetical protein
MVSVSLSNLDNAGRESSELRKEKMGWKCSQIKSTRGSLAEFTGKSKRTPAFCLLPLAKQKTGMQ